MASVFEKFAKGGRGAAESTELIATRDGAHFFNVFSNDTELDNGFVLAYPDPTKWKENDAFEAVAPTADDEIVLHLTPVKLYEEYSKAFQHEDNYFLGIGEVGRAYEIKKGDRFSISFNEDYVSDAIKACMSEDVIISFAGEMNAFKVSASDDESIVQIITPVRSYY